MDNESLLEGYVEGKRPYEKPLIRKGMGISFVLDAIRIRTEEKGIEYVCRQCSGCHGCR